MQERGSRLHLPDGVVAPGTELPIRLLQFISLSQHYEYGSVMTDFTDSPSIAGWFASHHWDGSVAPGPDGAFGVIYRFEMVALNDRLSKLVLTSTKTGAAISSAGPLGAADIGSLGTDLGARPQAQRGCGLFGLEHSLSSLILCSGAGLTTFTFPLASVSGSETPYSKTTLWPPDDPLLGVFTPEGRGHTEAITKEEMSILLGSVGASQKDISSMLECRSAGLI